MKLDNRVRELVAIGASITANCQPCLKYHIGLAIESGVDEKEIAEAIEVGTAVRKGAASRMDKFISGLDYAVSTTSVPGEGCGCG